MEHDPIDWPAIVAHADDAELLYVHDQRAWDRDADLHAADYHAADCLIDAAGHVFALTRKQAARVVPEATGTSRSLHQVLGLVKAHAAQAGSCCVAKLYAPSIRDALAIVKSLDDDA